MKPARLFQTALFYLTIITGWSGQVSSQTIDPDKRYGANRQAFPPAPSVPGGLINKTARHHLDTLLRTMQDNEVSAHIVALKGIAESGDPRLAWVLSDLLRLSGDGKHGQLIIASAERLMGIKVDRSKPWQSLTNYLIAWDIPDFDGYLEAKRALYGQLVPEWRTLMSGDGIVDWRHVSWGGVGIDNRPYDQTDQRINTIPAVDNPKVTSAFGGRWLKNDEVVFGVVINGEARAYPRFIMEIREMVNDTLGGRDFAMPYCTLCGAAHVWFTDRVPDGVKRPVLRTSGLLIRSNKLMYDVVSGSVFDTFLGKATNGRLYQLGVALPGHPVVSTTWGEWKKAHPKTTVVARQEALGRRSDLRTTRDAHGPIFPVGNVDPRLRVHEEVLGVINQEGKAIAFSVAEAKRQLQRGAEVAFEGVTLRLSSGGLIAVDSVGSPLVSHESFWFGWSQFRPDTSLWKANRS